MIIAVDTGGTKTLVAAFSSKGAIKHSVKFPTPADQTEYIELLIKTIKQFGSSSLEAISIALPNIRETNFVPTFSNLPWKNFDVVDELRPHFTDTIPIFVGNDAKLGGLGEVRLIDPTPHRALYVTISTGIGTGLIIDGRISSDMIASEGGHIMLEYDGTLREWESFASGRAIRNVYKRYGSEITSPRTWQAINHRFSIGFLTLIPIYQPDVVIIGGSMGVHFKKYGPKLESIVHEQLPAVITKPRFIQAIHPDEAVIYGCYFHAIDTLAS